MKTPGPETRLGGRQGDKFIDELARHFSEGKRAPADTSLQVI